MDKGDRVSIWLYTGTPGSGKSYHAAQDIVRRLKRPGGLICNFPVNEDFVPAKRRRSHVEYWDNSELSAQRLVSYALEHHKIGKEGQTLVIIDECQIIFNCRDFGRKDRAAWVTLFSQHRKLGYNFILITQNDRMLDKQIRALVETEIKHRKLNNYGVGGLLISLTRMTWFVAIEYWYGGNKLKLGHQMFAYHKKYAKVYDSYKLFSDMVSAGGAVCAGGEPRQRWGPGERQPLRRRSGREEGLDAAADLRIRCHAKLGAGSSGGAAPCHTVALAEAERKEVPGQTAGLKV